MADTDVSDSKPIPRAPRRELPSDIRVPPHNLDAEKGVLGSVMLVNDYLDEVADFLRGEHFYLESHRMIFEAMHGLQSAGVHGFDPVIVAEELERRGQLEQAGGVDALIDILNTVPHAAHAKYYGEIVREKFVLRRLILACNDILKDCYSAGDESDDLIARAEQSIFQILEQQEASTQIEMKEILHDTLDRIRYRVEHAGSVSGLTTGFVDLDKQTNGMQPTELIIIAARPSMGKTALVCNIAEAVASTNRKGTLIFSLEQSKLELAERFLCIRAKIQLHKLRKGELDNAETQHLLEIAGELSELPLYIDDTPARTMSQVSAIARRIKRKSKHGLGVVIVDYLQLLEPDDKRAPREQQIAGITRRLKFLAKELQIPVIALAQLNRGVELREDKRPKLADLRESGAIEQDADIVMFLHRPEMYNPEDRPGEAEIVVAKHRSGPTGIVPLTFNKASMRFENFSPLAEPTGGYFSTGLAGDNSGF
jgi:replicative DNA helicase